MSLIRCMYGLIASARQLMALIPISNLIPQKS